MNNKRDLINIAEVYSNLLDQVQVIEEAKKTKKAKKVKATKGISHDTFELVAGKDKSTKSEPFVGKKSGPTAAGGFKEDILDPKKSKKKDKFYGSEKFSQLKVEKTEPTNINICMKSTFDKLFENVMNGGDIESTPDTDLDNDLDAPDSEGDLHSDELGETEDVHSKLAKALDLLQQVQSELEGADSEVSDIEGDIDAEGGSEGLEDDALKENIDIKELGDKSASLKKVGGKANVVGDETSKMVDGKEGDGKVTDKVTGNEKGKEGKSTSVTGKANVVSGKASNVGKSIFAK